jgi:hypothetical protein
MRGHHQDAGGDRVLKKIVIRTDQTAPGTHLLSLLELLNRFFPECEVHIVSKAETAEYRDLMDRPRGGL